MSIRIRSATFDGRPVPMLMGSLTESSGGSPWLFSASLDGIVDHSDDDQPPELVMVATDGRTFRGPAILVGEQDGTSGHVGHWRGTGTLTRGG